MLHKANIKRFNRITDFIRQNQLYFLSFFLPFFIMLFLFIFNGIYPFGDQSFLYSDLEHQYYPFLLEFRRKLLSGDSLFFSWNTGLGSNFLSLYAYYLATPFYWLSVFIPEAYLSEFISYLAVFKIGLCGLTASIYLANHFHKKSRVIALFSLFYALSGHMAAYNWNVMWLDSLILTPLIILGLEKLVSEKKYKLYYTTLALSILSNYYISIMICLYLALYFFIILLPSAQDKWKSFMRFAVFSILSASSAAILLIPAIKALPFASRTTTEFPSSLTFYSSPFEVLARHFMNVTPDVIDYWPHYWPNIYCSVAIFILLPLYIFNKKIARKEKIGKLALLSFMFLSFSINITNYIWHGFTYPKALPARQSFLYILLLLTICFETYLHIEDISNKNLILTFTGILLYFIWANIFITDEDITTEAFLSSVGFLLIYGVFLCLYLWNKLTTRTIAYLFCIIIIAEAAGNTMAISLQTTLRSQSLHKNPTISDLVKEQTAISNEKYYRYDKVLRDTDNDSLLQNYPSLSLFSSTASGLANHWYEKYGMYGKDVHITAQGSTPFLYGLLAGGYTFCGSLATDETFYESKTIKNSVALYKNKYSVPLGFCIYPNTKQEDYLISDIKTTLKTIKTKDNLDPFQRQNLLAENLGAKEPLFAPLLCEDLSDRSTIYVSEDAHVYAYYDTTNYVEISVSINGEDHSSVADAFLNHMLDFGHLTPGTTIELQGRTDSSDTPFYSAQANNELHICAGALNVNTLGDVMTSLNQDTMNITSMDSNSLSGTIRLAKDGYVILSIPYDPGFSVMVDGIKTTPLVFDDMMIAIPATSGDHTLSLTFYPAGLNMGIVISVCSIFLFVFICIQEKSTKPKIKF